MTTTWSAPEEDPYHAPSLVPCQLWWCRHRQSDLPKGLALAGNHTEFLAPADVVTLPEGRSVRQTRSDRPERASRVTRMVVEPAVPAVLQTSNLRDLAFGIVSPGGRQKALEGLLEGSEWLEKAFKALLKALLEALQRPSRRICPRRLRSD